MKAYDRIFYIAILALSALFLFVGNRIASGEAYTHDYFYDVSYYTGVVTEITDRAEDNHPDLWFSGTKGMSTNFRTQH